MTQDNKQDLASVTRRQRETGQPTMAVSRFLKETLFKILNGTTGRVEIEPHQTQPATYGGVLVHHDKETDVKTFAQLTLAFYDTAEKPELTVPQIMERHNKADEFEAMLQRMMKHAFYHGAQHFKPVGTIIHQRDMDSAFGRYAQAIVDQTYG